MFPAVTAPTASSCAVILFAANRSANILLATTSDKLPFETSLDRSIPAMIASVSVTGCQTEPSQRHWPITSPFTTRNHWSPSPAPSAVGSLIEYRSEEHTSELQSRENL